MISFDAARVPSPSCKPVGTTVDWPAAEPGCDHVLIKQILKLRAPRFISGRVRVGEIVRDVIYVNCWAVMPLAALYKARIIDFLLNSGITKLLGPLLQWPADLIHCLCSSPSEASRTAA